MAAADLEVGKIVRRSNLHCAGAEFTLDSRISDNRNLTSDQRQPYHLADKPGVARIVRMHRDGDVAEDRLGPRRRDGYRSGAVRERITDVPKIAVNRLMIDFKVRQRGLASRAPVDKPAVAINQ